MAHIAKLFVALACSVFVAAVVSASDSGCTRTHKFQAFEQNTGAKRVFGKAKEAGRGYVLSYALTKSFSNDSEVQGNISGMFVFTSKNKATEICTLSFVDTGEEGDVFAGAELFINGVWFMDKDVQDFAIVGGTQGLTGAQGSVTFTRVGTRIQFVQGTVYLQDFISRSSQPLEVDRSV